MQQLEQGKASALGVLYHRYKHILRSVVMKVMQDEADVEDVVQDVFIQVWNRAKNYSSSKGKLICWLSTMARRRALDRIRRRSAYQRATDRYEAVCNHPDKGVEVSHTVEHAAHQDDVRKLLDLHIGSLPTAQQTAIRLSFYECKTQREIAALTNTPLGTVKTRIELGIKKLSNSIEGLREEIQ